MAPLKKAAKQPLTVKPEERKIMIRIKKTFHSALLGLSLVATVIPARADLLMGVFPRRPVSVTHKLFKPLAAKLSQELGEPVKLVVSKDFKSFWKGVKSGKFDIVHYNQYHYLLSKPLGYEVFAVNKEFGNKTIAGALSVRKDSGIDKVQDLKGKTVLFGGGKKAMGSYIAPTYVLQHAGLEAGKDYTVKFAKNPPSAVIAVYNKAADAAGSGNVVLKIKGVQKKIDTSKMKILAESEPFIQLPWAVKSTLPADTRTRVQQVMTSLKKTDPSILKAAAVDDFVPAGDNDFDTVRKIVKAVTGEDL